MAKKFSVKSKSSIFKSLGLLALILFTFYFIYNYLATGSFSLKPRASEIVVNDAGLTSCSQLLTDVDCNRLKDRGCSWVVGPSTTKTEEVKYERDCTTANCTNGKPGCDFVTQTKITGYTNQPIYECEQSGLSESKCKQLGFDWFPSGKTTKVPITSTTKVCQGTWTDTQTNTVTVPGVGSCTGTLKPLTPQLTPKSTPVVPGDPRVVNSTTTTPTPSSGTCSAGMTRCSATYAENDSVDVCVGNGKWQLKNFCAGASCTNGKCDIKAIKVTPKIQFGSSEPNYPSGRSVKCTYNYTKAFDLLTVTNPDTRKRVFIYSFSKQFGDEYGNGTPCSNKDIGRIENIDLNNDTNLDNRQCVPLNINGCGNIGTWFVDYYFTPYNTYNPIRYNGDQQYFQCSDSYQCQNKFGKYYICNNDLNRCGLNLERQACSGHKGQPSCESAFYYDANGTKHFCEWYNSSSVGFVCDSTVDMYN